MPEGAALSAILDLPEGELRGRFCDLSDISQALNAVYFLSNPDPQSEPSREEWLCLLRLFTDAMRTALTPPATT